MATIQNELNDLFAINGLAEIPSDVLGELQSILRLHALSPQELSYKWEAYSIKMGAEQMRMDLATVREFKKDLQETLERESRGKAQARIAEKRVAHATPRSVQKGDDFFGMLDGIVPNTPLPRSANGAAKRKAAFETPTVSKSGRTNGKSSPSDGRATNGDSSAIQTVPFSERQNAGQITETLNDQLEPCEPPIAPPSEPRVTLKGNTDLKKFFYKPMAMHLSEASEVLDERIDEFQQLVQSHHELEDSAFGSAASQSTAEVIAVGRIASDALEGKLNSASMVLETSRRTGAGLRVPLKLDAVSYEFFPGQIIAVRGINASGENFTVSEVLEIPMLPPAASLPSNLDLISQRLGINEDDSAPSSSYALNLMVAAGPYTADDNLAFEPLHELCEKAESSYADVLIMTGPFLDIEHPLLATGDFDVPDDPSIEPDKATLTDLFRLFVAVPLTRLAQAVPNITIIMVPSTRDAINKHVSWPQEPLKKGGLGLPKQAKMVTNPMTLSLNEIVIGISAQDVLYDIRQREVLVGKTRQTMLSRLPRHLIQQRHFFPLFPPEDRKLLQKNGTEEGIATGAPLDVSYLKLGEWPNVQPDMLITPSALTPFAKVVESVLVVNPGPLSKRRGPGTYAQMALHPRIVSKGERTAERESGKMVPHLLYDRARVDVIKI